MKIQRIFRSNQTGPRTRVTAGKSNHARGDAFRVCNEGQSSSMNVRYGANQLDSVTRQTNRLENRGLNTPCFQQSGRAANAHPGRIRGTMTLARR